MKRFKFLQRNFNYKLQFICGVEVDEALRAEFLVKVNMNKDYEIILITDNYFVGTQDKLHEIIQCYGSSDNIETLIAHLKMRFIDAFLKD